ncbi:hypothetical protein CCACVL1_06671 [Corchorus capsularis]|uniref:PGG domain-containing protein n=1 Tax=Corchorus capsularis TaxID=210143 RepID=A0A1R3JDW0_COCAP|nr:hypothetical protein CCACVL1_06671 [Corchorus capsularis]
MKEAEAKTEEHELFEYAMEDQWEEVVKKYKENPKIHMAKITESEDTALHLAVSGGKLEFVLDLVEILGENASNVLKAKNKKGNTPLHIAAELGNAAMCYCMASKDYKLVAETNEKNETPFYLAAQFGHEDAFLCLYFCYKQENRSDICSRDASGNTILHAAIDGEHFDLAFQIICKYPELVDTVNVNGLSPLHILAMKTNAFRSGSHLGLIDTILYRCVMVDEVKDKKYASKDYLERFEEIGNRRPCYPQNYQTCMRFFRMFTGVVCFGMPSVVKICCIGRNRFLSFIKYNKNKGDEENPRGTDKISDQGGSPNPKAKEKRKNELSTEQYIEGCLAANYATVIQFLKFVMKLVLVVLGLGFQRIKKITIKKQRHTWAAQVMNKLIDNTSMYKFSGGQTGPTTAEFIPFNPTLMTSSRQHTSIETLIKQAGECQNETDSCKKEGNAAIFEKFLEEYNITGTVHSKSTSKQALKMKFERKVAEESIKPNTPILIAASNGITEMVKKILEKFPVAIQDVDPDNKNVMLLAVENRQTHTFQFLIERQILHDSVFRKSDNHGNNALHLAATYGQHRPWLIPGAALQMQWELKWYEEGQTPKQIFTATHKSLVKDGSEWLTKTSESCSLIATVAFATAANIPGGVNDNTGEPVLRNDPAFGVFAISSLIALCFSLTALVFFLAILTSRFEEKDFAKKLPRKLILGLTSLFTSIAAILVSFCAGHFFELRQDLRFAAFPIYTVTCLPISFFALAQLPLYLDLLWAICTRVPRRGYTEA